MDSGKPLPDADLTMSDWHRLVARSSLSKADKNVARTLATYADVRTGANIYPGNHILAIAIGYAKPEYLGPHLQSLRRKGWIAQVAPANVQRGKSAKYALTVPLDADAQMLYAPDMTPLAT